MCIAIRSRVPRNRPGLFPVRIEQTMAASRAILLARSAATTTASGPQSKASWPLSIRDQKRRDPSGPCAENHGPLGRCRAAFPIASRRYGPHALFTSPAGRGRYTPLDRTRDHE
jgi:hypothetical protein